MRLNEITQGAKEERGKKRSEDWALSTSKFRGQGGKKEPANETERELRTGLTWKHFKKERVVNYVMILKGQVW